MVTIRLVATFSFLATTAGFTPLSGVRVTRVSNQQEIDLGESLASDETVKLCVLGTYAADFNAIEYAQRLRYYLPQLKEKGVDEFKLVLNASPASCEALSNLLDLPAEVELLSDPSGSAGLRFGVGRGWLPEDDSVSPYLKLFGMLWGLGAAQTLPYVIMGYIGNPWGKSGWIENALAVGQTQGRWPNNALEITNDGTVINQFSELPVVGGWGRRPLELATLRLQNMIGVSIAKWGDLAPNLTDHPSVLTQLGGCVLLGKDGRVIYEWKDPGICAVASFDDIVTSLSE